MSYRNNPHSRMMPTVVEPRDRCSMPSREKAKPKEEGQTRQVQVGNFRAAESAASKAPGEMREAQMRLHMWRKSEHKRGRWARGGGSLPRSLASFLSVTYALIVHYLSLRCLPQLLRAQAQNSSACSLLPCTAYLSRASAKSPGHSKTGRLQKG
eukprot:scaffold99765_cov20-Tisochrysis_lutea.AAC.1